MTVRSAVVKTRRTSATGEFSGICSNFAASRSAVPIVSVCRALVIGGIAQILQDRNYRFLAKTFGRFAEYFFVEIDRNHAIGLLVARMHAAHEDVMRRGLAILGKQRRVGAAFRDVDDLRRGVAVDFGKVGQRGLDLEPAVLLQRAGDEGAAALLGFDNSIPRQQIDGLPDRDAGDAEFGGEHFVRRQPQALRPNSARDPLAEDVRDLRVFWNMAVGNQIHLTFSICEPTRARKIQLRHRPGQRPFPRSSGCLHWCWPT